ncbi:hypothetical protein PF005_g6136 [Phytophthora fragariae]|uniref:Uncharacterized protein n=1 Tax=Phytophthora fragariae TaxID=53985 RepID=A0A6A3MF46_9STRA|nr:hypothetical protein PF003_g24477 [Phytophthora fragariae]KAE8943241.1 hypothetical protein PF009_g7028 [Phytophthora fragariae]KAE9026823.1 hypothetical protein PF011_g2352 [Phytophthora fragariae]KAE9125007.1 hypothetical protein PF007_g6513 [Phytophthora fragariae]KAE9129176.1 hypothetical protein PF010_g4247 [Phytophthora fragariae]
MGNTGSAIGQCVLSIALVGVGAAIAAASFGGASLLASTLISAGVGGAMTTITNSIQGKPTSWGEWGKNTGIGAATGLLGGALCAGAGGLAKGLTEGMSATWKMTALKMGTKGLFITAGSTASSVACNTFTNVCNGRKPFEGTGVALTVGAVGGLFACGGAACFDGLKHCKNSFFSHPVTRHSARLLVDTASSVAGGVIGAGMTGQDMGHAAKMGLMTGAAVGTLTTAVRCSSKQFIRYRQRIERQRRPVVEGVRREGEVDFLLEQTTKRAEPRGHRDVDHVDRHHSNLKGRLDEKGHEDIPMSSRFRDLKTANKVRELALPEAAIQIENLMLEKSPHLDAPIQRDEVAAFQDNYINLKNANAPPHEIAAAKIDAQNAKRARAVVEQRANLVELNRRLTNLRTSRKATPAKIQAAELKIQKAHKAFDQVVGAYLQQVEVNVPMPGGCGYGYRRDGTRTREFKIRGATSYFRGAGMSDGSIAWREVTSFPTNVLPRTWADRVVEQRWRAGDRMNRPQVARNVLVQRHAAQHSNREEEEYLVGA